MNKNRVLLGVNIDHIATIRQARGTIYPNIVQAALEAEQGGADGITMHLREDRRHIQDKDVYLVAEVLNTRLNLEMAVTEEMLTIAKKVKPAHCCLVPEKRQEVTTEGGLDVLNQQNEIKKACSQLKDAGIRVSLFVDPSEEQILACKSVGADDIELHTGDYASANTIEKRQQELTKIISSVKLGQELGLGINAGHGLNYHNVADIAEIYGMQELNIGHAIVAEAFWIGLRSAVEKMKNLINRHSWQ